jgi:hypothetical protein
MEYQPHNHHNFTYNTNKQHPYNASCGYCQHDDYTYGEDAIEFIYPTTSSLEPFRYNYLLNLMTAPDMSAYLSVDHDDIFNLPIHLQRLIIEAKEEIVLKNTDKPAQQRLERVRNHIWQRSDGDFSILMNTLIELVSDEDELEDLLRL